MPIIIATFLAMYVIYTYFTPFIKIKEKLPKLIRCGSCTTFWVILVSGLFTLELPYAIIAAFGAYLAYQALYKIL
jgi:hypothetical protein